MTTYYKAVRPDGTDFHSGQVQWVPVDGLPEEGWRVDHPTSTEWEMDHSTHLCASSELADCKGFSWPCRLLTVEPITEAHHHGRSKWSALSWRVTGELPAWRALGPCGEAVARLVGGLRLMTPEQAQAAGDAARYAARYAAWVAAGDAAGDAGRDAAGDAAWDAARYAAGVAAWDAAGDAAWDAAWDAGRDAAWDAARALVVADLIRPHHSRVLTSPIAEAVPELWAEVMALLPEGVQR